MKVKIERLSHEEIMTGLTRSFRELVDTNVKHVDMPVIINRARAVAAIVTAHHHEELMQLKRQGAQQALLKGAEVPKLPPPILKG